MRCAVIGDPVGHSLSPVIHTAGYVAAGLGEWEYEAIAVEAGHVGEFLDSLGPQWRGLSVTAPHKREALALAESVTDRARLAGGVNTLVRTETGWAGDNTDLPGAVSAIRERTHASLPTGLIWGGGATAASIGLAFAELGVTDITLAVRTTERARDTANAIAAHPAKPSVHLVTLDSIVDEGIEASIVASTIPIAAQTAALVARARPTEVLFEATYNTWPTPAVTAAWDRGVKVVSGLDLLVHQATLQFEQFTGQPAPLAAMRAAGEAALASRTT